MTRRSQRISPDAIYRSRSIRATLDQSDRDKVQTARDRIGEALAETLSDAIRSKLETARDQLNEVLGTGAARETGAQLGGWPILARRLPRTMADVARTYYATQEGSR
jgi:hypothetical protein